MTNSNLKIYKLQLPIASSGEEQIFAYPQDDPADMFLLPINKKNLRWFPVGATTTFVWAEAKNNSLKIHRYAPWQEW